MLLMALSSALRLVALAAASLAVVAATAPAAAQVPANAEVHDAHFHLTNYIQEGTDIRDFLAIMGDKVGRSVVLGLPLQQTWSYGNTGDFATEFEKGGIV